MTAIPTWRSVARMSRFLGRYSVAHALIWAVMSASALLPALLARAFFDALTGEAPSRLGMREVILLLVALAIGQAALWMLGGYVEIVFRFRAAALLRRNLLARLLDRPGTLPLPYAIGGTIARFRDDVDVAEDILDWTDEIVGQGLVAAVAVAVLLSVDPWLTMAAVLPLVAVVAVAQRASGALGRARAASSEAGSDVAAALGDMLTAAETVRAAGA